MCLGAQKAIADAGRSEEMFLVGVDGEKAALTAIMAEGSNYATNVQRFYNPEPYSKIFNG